MALQLEQERVKALLTEAITVLCKNGLGYKSEFCIDGLLGITIDKQDVFLVKINETISRERPYIASQHHTTREQSHVTREQNAMQPVHQRSGRMSAYKPQTIKLTQSFGLNNIPSENSQEATENTKKRSFEDENSEVISKRLCSDVEDMKTDPVVIKKEVIDEADLSQESDFTETNSQNNQTFPADTTDSFDSPGQSKWPNLLGSDPMLNNSLNLNYDGDNTKTSAESDGDIPKENDQRPSTNSDKLSLQSNALQAQSEAARLAFLQHQTNFLQAAAAATGMSQTANMWQQISPEYLRMQHKMARPYACEECGKTFSSSCGRRRHMDTHRGIYPYRCEHCGKGFTASNNLRAHMTVHTNVNNFRCDICGETFRYSQYLKDHVKREHLDALEASQQGLGVPGLDS